MKKKTDKETRRKIRQRDKKKKTRKGEKEK